MGSSKPTAAQVAQRDLSRPQNKTDVNIRDRFMDGGGREVEAESGQNARPTLCETVGNNHASVFDCLCIRGLS